MTLGVYLRTADGRTVRLRPTASVEPVVCPDIHSGLRYPPCRCPRHDERAADEERTPQPLGGG
ncbi:hypothetical protein ACIQGZ_10730 [Streptomyces sp. NPDC092296]|uniref:hypothetical protein n=1 Tax=Streptomyces sp. NPDC092296 TaxID=3366012 RepID=UPI00380D23FB